MEIRVRTAAWVLLLALSLGVGSAHAGSTILTHGFNALSTNPPDWVFALGRAVLAADGDASDCGAIGGQTPIGSVLVYEPSDGSWTHECGSLTPNGEIVLVFNWSEESDGLTVGGTQGFAEAAADALYAALRDPVLPGAFAGQDLLAGDVHFVGHSRGAVVNSDCAERLAAAGIPIDQVTALDPHPVDGTLDYPLSLADWGDRAPVTWTGVDFTDNYWRADGGGLGAADFDGMSLPVDVDLDLGGAIEGFLDVDPIFEHTEVHAWYFGTIDLTANDDNAGTSIDNELFTDWWDDAGVPARDLTGFYYSAIVGGARPGPVAGMAPGWSPQSIYNGSFEIVNSEVQYLGVGYAGWYYHGGDKAGVLVPWNSLDPPVGSNYYATLLSLDDELMHNRLYVDSSVGALELKRRVSTASPNDRLQISLVDSVGDVMIADAALSSTTGWETISFPIAALQNDRSYALRLRLDGGGDGVESIVDLDDLQFIPEPPATLQVFAGVVVLGILQRRRAQLSSVSEPRSRTRNVADA